jgi:nucleoid-associated protein YgaU
LDAYRKRLEQRQIPVQSREKKSVSFFYVASSLLTVVCLALGISAISNYDRLKNVEVAIQRLAVMTGDGTWNGEGQIASDSASGDEDTPVTNVISVDANVSPLDDSASDASENSDASTDADTATELTTDNTEENSSEDDQSEDGDTEASTPVIASDSPKYYTVQGGDTLSSISFSMYHSILYVDDIMEANNMKNGDDIYVGQVLIIPALP